MRVQNFVKDTYRKYTGKTTYPAVGTDMYVKILDWGNYFMREEYAKDPEHNWDSCFEERDGIGTISADSRSYVLDDDITDLSDAVFIVLSDGREVEFKVVKARDRHKYRSAGSNYVYKSGHDPVQVTFIGDGAMPDDLVDGEIRAGCYVVPADMTKPNGLVPVDRPSWLVCRVAAELARTDRSREEQYSDLMGEANEQYRLMAAANEALPDGDSVPVAGYSRVAGIEEEFA